jgi:hypothetical protein
MWLLTPALFACLQLQGERIDSRVLAGELPAERARVGAQQFAAVYEYANQWFADDEVEVAYREFAAGGPQAVGEYVASLGEPEAEDAGRGPWVDIGDVAVASGWQWTPWAEHQIPDTSAGA